MPCMAESKFSAELVAPCGMNCALCRAYLAYSRGVPKKKGQVSHCTGCRVRNKQCAFVKRDCQKLRCGEIQFCYQCIEMPCRRLSRIDEHYRARYGISFIENIKEIQTKGIEAFLAGQQKKFSCPSCGDVVSVHDAKCYKCGYQGEKPKGKNPAQRWVPNSKTTGNLADKEYGKV